MRHCEERQRRSNPRRSKGKDGLLRGACHRAALCADPLARNDDFGAASKMSGQRRLELYCPRRLLERFRAKWAPVRVKKTRQNKNLEPPFRFNRNGKGSRCLERY